MPRSLQLELPGAFNYVCHQWPIPKQANQVQMRRPNPLWMVLRVSSKLRRRLPLTALGFQQEMQVGYESNTDLTRSREGAKEENGDEESWW